MSNIRRFITTFCYAGLTEQEMKMCAPEIKKRNAVNLGWVLVIMLGALLALTVVSYIPGTGEEPNRKLYMFFLLLIAVQFLVFKLHFEHNHTRILILGYIFMLTAYGFGIFEATCLGENSSNTVFCVFLVAVPLLVVDVPARLTLMILFVEAVLLIVHSIVGNQMGDRFLEIESISCLVLGISCSFLIQRTKFSDIRNHLMLEMQRDTDMMTGANSRVAYIRDIDVMSDRAVSAGIVFADVNGLKRANDTLGHEAGDRLIKDAFSLMIKYFHEVTDRIYRIGGDEFVIISVGEDKESFEERFISMTQKDENSDILSCGSIWQERIKDTEAALNEAEKLMYHAKGSYYHSHPELDRRSR